MRGRFCPSRTGRSQGCGYIFFSVGQVVSEIRLLVEHRLLFAEPTTAEIAQNIIFIFSLFIYLFIFCSLLVSASHRIVLPRRKAVDDSSSLGHSVTRTSASWEKKGPPTPTTAPGGTAQKGRRRMQKNIPRDNIPRDERIAKPWAGRIPISRLPTLELIWPRSQGSGSPRQCRSCAMLRPAVPRYSIDHCLFLSARRPLPFERSSNLPTPTWVPRANRSQRGPAWTRRFISSFSPAGRGWLPDE